ncbi:MAG: ATP-binding protein [Promethearchaeota archaeon]
MFRSKIHWSKDEREYFWFRPILINWLTKGCFFLSLGVLFVVLLIDINDILIILVTLSIVILSSALLILNHYKFYKISSLLFLFGFTILICINTYLTRFSTNLGLLFAVLIGAGILSTKKVTISLFLIQVIFTILLASFGILDWAPQKDPHTGLYYATSIFLVLEILITGLILGLIIRHLLLNTILNQSKTAEFLEITLKSIKSGIITTDLEKKVLLINSNAEKMIGVNSDSIIGESLSAFFLLLEGDADQNIFLDPFDPIFLSSETHFRTNSAKLKGINDNLDIEFNTTPIQGEKKDTIGYIVIFWDITERKKSEELKRKFHQELELQVKVKTRELNDLIKQQNMYQDHILKSSQFKSEFMASMSHELRTPLNSIIGFTDVVLEGIGGNINKEQDRYLNNVKSSALHLLNLINDILDIAKIESGKMELNVEKILLSKVINQVGSMIKPMYREKNLQYEVLEFDISKNICIDRKRFMEILFNLLSNAIKYTREGKITLQTLEKEGEWVFNIVDTGIGIARKDFDIIFKEFLRVNSEFTNSIEGTGLGLPFTRKLVELHGGNISFTSELGKGSTFSFTIPKKVN